MLDEPHQGHLSQLEHAITTVLACLSMVKYNAALGEEQRKELINDIEGTLQFLRKGLFANTAIEASYDPEIQRNDQRTLQALYKIYHAYVNKEQGNIVEELVVRFNEIISIIDTVQNVVEQRRQGLEAYNVSHQKPVEDSLHRVKGFIADLYYMFMELMRALAEALQVSKAHIDTEEVSSLRKQLAESTGEYSVRDMPQLAPLINVYEMHRRFSAQKGALARQVSEAIAFLEFLEECVGRNFNKRYEIVTQITKLVKLLSDIAHLLSSYESATATILRLQ